jgi:hypothetical protein
METPKFETSIGTVQIKIETHNEIAVETDGIFVELGRKEFADRGTFPYVYVPLTRKGDHWEVAKSDDYPFLHTDIDTEVPIPQALIDELATLGKEWAGAHPEAFERRVRERFEFHCGCVKDTYAQAIIDLQKAEEDLKSTLKEPDFNRVAPPEVRRQAREGAKTLRAIRLQVRAMLDATAGMPGDVSECLRT